MANRSAVRVVIPLNLGAADGFDRSIFPISTHKSDVLARGEIFLQATVEGVLSIASMSTSLGQSEDFTTITKLRHAELMQEKNRLENRAATRNPFKEFANYRAIKIFYKAAKSLYIETKTTSELMKRETLHTSVEVESASRVKANDRNDERSSIAHHDPPLPARTEPTTMLPKGEHPVDVQPTIGGIVASDVDLDKVPELEKTVADAFHVLINAVNSNSLAIKELMDLNTFLENGAADPTTCHSSHAPSDDERSDSSAVIASGLVLGALQH